MRITVNEVVSKRQKNFREQWFVPSCEQGITDLGEYSLMHNIGIKCTLVIMLIEFLRIITIIQTDSGPCKEYAKHVNIDLFLFFRNLPELTNIYFVNGDKNNQ